LNLRSERKRGSFSEKAAEMAGGGAKRAGKAMTGRKARTSSETARSKICNKTSVKEKEKKKKKKRDRNGRGSNKVRGR